jgi:hypothetical protein
MMCQRWDSLLVSMVCYDSFNFQYMMWQSHGYIYKSLGVTERLCGDISGRYMGRYTNGFISGNDIREIIDVNSYAEGMYIMTIQADNQKYSIKFVKE